MKDEDREDTLLKEMIADTSDKVKNKVELNSLIERSWEKKVLSLDDKIKIIQFNKRAKLHPLNVMVMEDKCVSTIRAVYDTQSTTRSEVDAEALLEFRKENITELADDYMKQFEGLKDEREILVNIAREIYSKEGNSETIEDFFAYKKIIKRLGVSELSAFLIKWNAAVYVDEMRKKDKLDLT
jgi:hypothetical protein